MVLTGCARVDRIISHVVQRTLLPVHTSSRKRMVHARVFSHMVRPPDLSRISANFYESGISLERIRAVTAEEGLAEVRLRRWNERETGILSYLDNRMFRAFRVERFQRTFYSLILERPAAT